MIANTSFKNKLTLYFLPKVSNSLDVQEKEELYSKLVQLSTRGDNIEKLNGRDVWSIRQNEKSRVLFTIANVQGKPAYVVLDVLPNHKYDRSKFIKNKHWKAKYLNTIKEKMAKFESTESNEEERAFKTVRNTGAGFIIFNDEQNKASSTAMPLIISGPPGSGKTSVAIDVLQRGANTYCLQGQRVLYVTRSEMLAKRIKQDWSLGYESRKQNVEIKHYNEVFNTKDITNEFESWVEWVSDNIRKVSGNNRQATQRILELIKNDTLLYQEFRIISGLSLEAYSKISKKQSYFKESDRKMLHGLYERWISYLKESNTVYSEFHNITDNMKSSYEIVIVDEAQDFSLSQLNNLKLLSKNFQIVYCLDNRQNVHDENPKLASLKKLLSDNGNRKISFQSLSKHYRCPKEIMMFAKVFNDIRLMLRPKSKKETVIVDTKITGGTVLHVKPTDKKQLKEISTLYQENADACIVTLPEFQQEAREQFDIPQVLTPETIKGLEYKIIILYKVLNSHAIHQADKLLGDTQHGVSQKTAVSEGCFSQLSSCFVAATRASERVIFIDDLESHKIKNINKKLKSCINNQISIKSTKAVRSSKTDWQRRLQEQQSLGHHENAISILPMFKSKQDLDLDMASSDKNSNHDMDSHKKTSRSSVKDKTDKTQVSKRKSKRKIRNKKNFTSKKIETKVDAKKRIPGQKEIDNLILACHHDNYKKVATLLKEYKYSKETKARGLLLSSELGRMKLVRLFVERGALMNNMEEKYSQVLFCAAFNGHRDVVEYLIECDLNINYRSEFGLTALGGAAIQGRLNIVKLLIEAGAQTNICDNQGTSILGLAAQSGHANLVEYLVGLNENINAQNLFNATPVFLAVYQGRLDCVKKLVQLGADVNLCTKGGGSPLSMAVHLGRLDIVKCLVNAKVNINQIDPLGISPLMFAIKFKHFEIVKYLLTAGADVNQTNKFSQTPLMAAARYGLVDVAKALIEFGADPDMIDSNGKGALDDAKKYNHMDVATLILTAIIKKRKESKKSTSNKSRQRKLS